MADDLNKDLSRSEKLLKDRLTSTGKVARDITNKAFRELIENIDKYGRSLYSITNSLEEQLKTYSKIKGQTKTLGENLNRNLKFIDKKTDLSQRLVGIYKEQNKLNEKLVGNQEDLLTGELSSKKVNDDLLKVDIQRQNISLRQRDIDDEIARQRSELVNASKDEEISLKEKIAGLEEINQNLKEEQTNLTDISKNLEQQAKSAEDIETKVGIGGKLLSGFKKIPGLGDLMDMEGAETAMKATAAEGGSMFATLGAGAKALGSSLKAALGPLGLILMAVEAIKAIGKFFLDAMLAADERVTKLAKGMSLTKDEARGVYNSLKDTKFEMNSIYNTTKDVTEAFTDLVDLTDFVTSATDEMIEAQIILTKNIGLSKEEAFGVQEAFANSNIEADKGIDIVNNQLAAFANQNKLLSTGKAVFNDIAKTSKLIQINFNGNLGALAKTTLEAKKLGLTLDQVSKIGSSLLNFEESISSELEAELLTGMNINLEKARSYALNHDIAGLAQEITNQGITQEKFTKMNVIQQEAIAKSLGMSAEEMGDMLYKQKVLEKVGGQTLKNLRERAKATEDINLQNKVAALEAGILSGKSFEESEKATTAQEKFNQALEQAKEIFTDLVDGGYLEDFANAIKSVADFLTGSSDEDRKVRKKAKEQAMQLGEKAKTPEEKEKIEKLVEQSNERGTSLIKKIMMGPTIGGAVAIYDYFNTTRPAESAREELDTMAQNQNIKVDAKDFTIRTLPENTAVGMGGTALGRTDEMVKLLIQQNQHLDKQNTLLADIKDKKSYIGINGTVFGTTLKNNSFKTL
jgi:hypothetical protein